MVGDVINCACGCGQLTTDETDKYVPRKYIDGHQQRLKGAANYKTGKEITKEGYVRVLISDEHPKKHRGKVFEQILVMEKMIGNFSDNFLYESNIQRVVLYACNRCGKLGDHIT